jgi:ABC-2 type transport system permease protein
VLTASFSLLLNLVPVLVFALASGVRPMWSWLWFLPLLAVFVVWTAGLAVWLSALFVRYRDIEPIWDVLLQITFYASAIFFPIDQILAQQKELGRIIMANPFAAILQEMRHVVISPQYMSAADAIGMAWRLVVPAAVVVLSIGLGYRYFAREAPRIAEDL